MEEGIVVGKEVAATENAKASAESARKIGKVASVSVLGGGAVVITADALASISAGLTTNFAVSAALSNPLGLGLVAVGAIGSAVVWGFSRKE
jgi:hypothetical protein